MTATTAATLRERLKALEDDNLRLRTALAEAHARGSKSGNDFLTGDAIAPKRDALVCLHPAVSGRVTVIIPVWNGAKFLERAVTSVWEQTYPKEAIEMLVIDDGSTDGSRALAQRLARKSPVAMRVLAHDDGSNRGVSPTRHLAVRESTGEFIALLDVDDVFLAERLGATVNALVATPSAVAVCSFGRNIDAAGKPVPGYNGTHRAGEWRMLGDSLSPPFSFEQLWQLDPIANSTLTIRRSALEAIGGFPNLMAHQAEDWLLVLKLSLLAPIPCLEQELILYTHHAAAYTTGYHANGWGEGARLETFYHLAWWMLQLPTQAEAGARFFRREYPRLIADMHRLLPVLRDYYADGGRPAAGRDGLCEHLAHLSAELNTLRRTVRAALSENRQLRGQLAASACRKSVTA